MCDKCRWGDGVDVKPDGVHSLDPCIYEEIETIEHCIVHVLQCVRCGHMEFTWEQEEGEE